MMSLDDLIYSFIGVDKDVVLVSDEKTFKLSVDSSKFSSSTETARLKDNIIEEDNKIVNINAVNDEQVDGSNIEILKEQEQGVVENINMSNNIVPDIKADSNVQVLFDADEKLLTSAVNEQERKITFSQVENPVQRLKDLYSKLLNPKLFQNSIEYIQYYTEFDELFNSISYKNIRQLNVVLDIDNTILFATDNIPDNLKLNKQSFRIRLKTETRSDQMTIIIREGLEMFFKELKDFSNFYINTHGLKIYADEICKQLNTRFNCDIKSNRIIARDNYSGSTRSKSLNLHIVHGTNPNEFYNNSIVLDDKPEVWLPSRSNCPVINSKKFIHFLSLNAMKEHVYPYMILIKKRNSYEFVQLDKTKESSILTDINGLVHVENETSKYQQLNYLREFIKKVHKFVNVLDCIFY
jgi:hypothetical protein